MMILPGEMGYFGDRVFSGGNGDGDKGRVSAQLVGRSLLAGVPGEISFSLSGSLYYDTLGELSANQFTPSSDGYYDLNLSARTQAPAGNSRDVFKAQIEYNGFPKFETQIFRYVSTFDENDLTYSVTFFANAGDAIRLSMVYQNVTGTSTTGNLLTGIFSTINFNKL